MGFGGNMSEKLNIGSIIYYTSKPIAWLMKPDNAGDLWQVGLLINYISENMCTILDSNGEYINCQVNMIIPYDHQPAST